MEDGSPLHLALTQFGIQETQVKNGVIESLILKFDEYQTSLDQMHKEVGKTLSVERKKSIERHNAKTRIKPCNFTIGDYVLVAPYHGPRTKVSANWVGPRRVVQCLSDYMCRVEHLLTEGTDDVHVSRMKHYADFLIGTKLQMKKNC